jgi:hypothetical protein
MLKNLSDSERLELEQLWQIRCLLKEINIKSRKIYVHLRLYDDNSGGIYRYCRTTEDYVELFDWNDLEEAVKVMREHLKSL